VQGREAGERKLAIGDGQKVADGVRGKPWTLSEIELVVDSHFYMLRMQESGQSVNKSEVNRRLKDALPARSLSSISQKHSNISAVLTHLGIQTVHGYTPLFNFQKALAEVVAQRLVTDKTLDAIARQRVQGLVETPVIAEYASMLVDPPAAAIGGDVPKRVANSLTGIKRDYLAREALNSSIGLAGELLALEFERDRLIRGGRPDLALRVEHVSVTRGDGLGFDIQSFCYDGRRIRIEVKTTSYGAHTPIFVSKNEVAQSNIDPSTFLIYRVFNIRTRPRIYILSGDIETNFILEPENYRATPRPALFAK